VLEGRYSKKGGKISQKIFKKPDNLSKDTNEFHTNTIASNYYLRPSLIMIEFEGRKQDLTIKITQGADNEQPRD